MQNDDDELIKVLDFGIAKASPGMLGTSVSPETRTGAILGTPYYMSPEQVDGIAPVDFRADVWALGVVAYQCLVGQLPFQGDSVGRLVLAICTRPLPVPSSAGSVPAGFDVWFARACARDVEQRFSSARQAASEFLALVDGAPSSAPALSAPRSAPAPSTAVAAPAPSETRATRSDPLRTTTGQATNAELLARSSGARRWRRTAPLVALGLVALAVVGWRLARPTATPEPARAVAALAPAPTAPLAASAAEPALAVPLPAEPAAPPSPEEGGGAGGAPRARARSRAVRCRHCRAQRNGRGQRTRGACHGGARCRAQRPRRAPQAQRARQRPDLTGAQQAACRPGPRHLT